MTSTPPAQTQPTAAPPVSAGTDLRLLRRPRLRVASAGSSQPVGAASRGGAKAVVAFVSLCAIWGSTWLAIKVGLRDLPPISFAGIRFALAALILYAIVAARGLRLPWAARDWRLLLWTGLLSITVNYALVFWAELHISSGLAAGIEISSARM